MKAIVQTIHGGPEVLHFDETPQPALRPHDLLVRVRAASVNPVDAKVRAGGAASAPVASPPLIVGWDAAGVVEAVGAETTLFHPGDEVYCAGDITRQGSYAELLAVDERIVGRKPATLSFEEAAAIPLTALTAWEGLFEQMAIDPLEPPRPILIVGGAGGVGAIAVQIAKRVAGLHVVATASRPESREYALQMGADAVIDHSQEYASQVRRLGLSGFDYIFSTAHLGNFEELVSVLNPLGKICLILSGPEAKTLDVSGLMGIRGTLTWELMFTRPRLGLELERQGQILNRVADLLDAGAIKTTMTKLLSWREVQEAHRQIETGHSVGKIVLRVDG
jgi:zinc-binding alcohol dehydrogenase family protein